MIHPTRFNFKLDLTPIKGKPGFYTVVNPIYVFKKVFGRWFDGYRGNTRIASLIIPVGAEMFIGERAPGYNKRLPNKSINHKYIGKLRASCAIVHSIVSRGTYNPKTLCVDKHIDYKVAHSTFNPSFTYRVGQFVYPKEPFSYEVNECASGIHFFLNIDDAVRY